MRQRWQRARKRDDNFPLIDAVLGLISLLSALRPQHRGLARTAGRLASMIAGLIIGGSVLALGVLLLIFSVLGNAVGDSGVGLLVCMVPAALLLFTAWTVVQSRNRTGQSSASTAPAEGTQAPAAATTSAPPTTAVQPAAAPAAPPIETYIEPRTHSPGEYRQRAASYRRRIQSLIRNRRPGPLANRLTEVAGKLGAWEERVGQLADRLALFESDDLIQRDIREVPDRITRLRRQAALEADPEMRDQMTRTLAAYEEQARQLQTLARVMRRTRLNLDDTLAAMGTIYSQAQVLNALDIDGATAARIADDIEHEVDRLNDLLSALSEVNNLPGPDATPAAEPIEDGTGGLAARKVRLGGHSS